MATPGASAVRFHLRGHVPAMCSIEEQRALPDGGATVVELEILCNLQAFTLSAPDSGGVALERAQLTGDGGGAAAARGDAVDFWDLRPGRHVVRLRIASASPEMLLSLQAR